MSELKERIMEALKGMSSGDLVALWNYYCDACNYCDDRIYYMEDFDDFYSASTPLEVATRVFYGHDELSDESNFNPNREFFYFNGYANPVSLDYIEYIDILDKWADSPFCPDDVADYIVDNQDALYNDEIQEILNEASEEEPDSDQE